MQDSKHGIDNFHFPSFNHMYEENTIDFNFWEEKNPTKYESSFRARAVIDSIDDFITFSPPFRPKNSMRARGYKGSPPLWPRSRGVQSSPRRVQRVIDGRRELMEMIQNMPESFYELSLKDMVHETKSTSKEPKEEVLVEERVQKCKVQRGKSVTSNGKSVGKKQISRSESMESGVFLLKMFPFIPLPLSFKKKPKARSLSKVSPRPASRGSEKAVSKDWWKLKSPHTKEKGISRSISDVGSYESRLLERRPLHSSQFPNRKAWEPRKLKGCFF